MQITINQLKEAVQHNCHIADARYAGDYTLCVYLLKMREFYRWEHGHGFADSLPHENVGQWLKQREALWEELEDQDYNAISVEGREQDPFDAKSINDFLINHNLVYSGGLGCKCRPHFFLAEKVREEMTRDYHLFVSDKELARDLTAPPAMSINGTIFVRMESLRRMLWEKLEESRWDKGKTPMQRAMEPYEFDRNIDLALELMGNDIVDQLILHEIGEIRAGLMLGPGWESMLAELPRSKMEIQLRAIRDHLADCISTLPDLLHKDTLPQQIHFYMANLSGMRKVLFPAMVTAYQQWLDGAGLDHMKEVVQKGSDHWASLAEKSLARFNEDGKEATKTISDLIEANPL